MLLPFSATVILLSYYVIIRLTKFKSLTEFYMRRMTYIDILPVKSRVPESVPIQEIYFTRKDIHKLDYYSDLEMLFVTTLVMVISFVEAFATQWVRDLDRPANLYSEFMALVVVFRTLYLIPVLKRNESQRIRDLVIDWLIGFSMSMLLIHYAASFFGFSELEEAFLATKETLNKFLIQIDAPFSIYMYWATFTILVSTVAGAVFVIVHQSVKDTMKLLAELLRMNEIAGRTVVFTSLYVAPLVSLLLLGDYSFILGGTGVPSDRIYYEGKKESIGSILSRTRDFWSGTAQFGMYFVLVLVLSAFLLSKTKGQAEVRLAVLDFAEYNKEKTEIAFGTFVSRVFLRKQFAIKFMLKSLVPAVILLAFTLMYFKSDMYTGMEESLRLDPEGGLKESLTAILRFDFVKSLSKFFVVYTLLTLSVSPYLHLVRGLRK